MCVDPINTIHKTTPLSYVLTIFPYSLKFWAHKDMPVAKPSPSHRLSWKLNRKIRGINLYFCHSFRGERLEKIFDTWDSLTNLYPFWTLHLFYAIQTKSLLFKIYFIVLYKYYVEMKCHTQEISVYLCKKTCFAFWQK